MPALYHFRPLVLIILDGWGIAPASGGNAVTLAQTPNFKRLILTSSHGQLAASGDAVGLPQGEQGNSEVGHLNIGAGKIVYQDFTRINKAVQDGSFTKNEALHKVIKHQKEHDSKIHLIGLVGGNVHSSLGHLLAILWSLKENNCKEVYLHLFTDGRDTPPNSGLNYISEVEKSLKAAGFGKIVDVGGRYWGMDRDGRWDRIEKAYLTIIGQGEKKSSSAEQAIIDSYKNSITDEFINPTMIVSPNSQPVGVSSNDGLIFFNFRPDRMRELTRAFVLKDFNYFSRMKIDNLMVMTMTEYEKDLPVEVAFKPENVELSLAQVLSEAGLHQLHIAETEKYAHVTYFLNGGREEPFAGEERIMIPSPKVSTYDLSPEMSAEEIELSVVKKLNTQTYDFIVANFANADMVGHSGKIPPTIKAIETVDTCLGKIAKTVESLNGCLVVTADHGNAEEMLNLQTGQPDTAHSTNPVPIIIHHPSLTGLASNTLNQGKLSDIAPTILHLMGISKPSSMTGRSLLDS